MQPTMFAILVQEREPLHWQDLLPGMQTWTLNAGGIAAVALILVALFNWIRRAGGPRSYVPAWQKMLGRLCILGMVLGYGGYFVTQAPVYFAGLLNALQGEAPSLKPLGSEAVQQDLLYLGAISALLAVGLPFLADLLRLRWRRIWALALLSFKEAIRRRVLWVFSALLLVFLFASWFLPYKPEDQVRNYVQVIFFAMTYLLLFTAGLLAAFSIPADIRSNTIHTIVTKPVEKFEIVVGRFLGFMLLMTIVLVVMTAVSLLYSFRETDPDAADESMRARVPVYGDRDFYSKDGKFQGENVGREWEYRKYIAGGARSSQRALYTFRSLPADLAHTSNEQIPCEFSFDIFRTLKGEEGKGVFCTFLFETHWNPKEGPNPHYQDYLKERDQARRQANVDRNAINNQLAEKYGIFEIPSMEIVDYHTQKLDLPAGLLRNALGEAPSRGPVAPGTPPPPQLALSVKCENGGQYVGMAKYDFYILDAERPFWLNFFKAAVGLWCRLAVVVGIAIACSTYLSGVIAFLATFFIYIAGFFQDYVRSLATGTSIGGGPMESFLRLVNKESLVTPIEASPAAQMATGTDTVYRFVLKRFLDVIPDVSRYDWTSYVAEGFNIPFVVGAGESILLSLIMLLAYLLPWAILAYYLMKSREVATY
jgi:ABC-type transport system involved in multi-copper enzyme maturation permease subunit